MELRNRAVRGAKPIAGGGKDVDGRSEAGVSLAAGPKPGMTRAELLEAVKGLGLKPRGTRKVDLEACWHEAVRRSRKADLQPSVAGVPVTTMTVAALRKHLRGMGLEPSGLKADLKRHLCEHLVEAQRATPADAPTEEMGEGRADLQPSVAGVPVTTMTVAVLRKHLRGMGLEPSGLKADLQRRLCEHLVEAQRATPADAPTEEMGKGRADLQPSVAGVPVTTMTIAVLRKHLRGMGLKPSGLKADLKRRLCGHLVEAQRATPADAPTEEMGEGRADLQPSVAGVPVTTMTVAVLRKHLRDMGLKPSGLKADLQRRLCEHLVEAQRATPADAPTEEMGEGRAEPVETIECRGLSPNCVSFRGTPVADMESDGGTGGEAVTDGDGGGGGGDGDRDENRDAGAGGSGSEDDNGEEAANSAWGVEDHVEDEDGDGNDMQQWEEENGKDGGGEGKEKQDEERNDSVEGEVGGKQFELDQATDDKPSNLPSSEVMAVSDGSPEVVDSARCPELRSSDKGEATDEQIESGRAAMDVDDMDGVNVDARSVSQRDRAPVEVVTQPADGFQWPDCPASEEELEGDEDDTVQEVDTEGDGEGKACEGGTENFDDESQHFDDGDIEEAPAHEDKDKVNAEFEAGEEAGPTQTLQVMSMVRSEGEKEDRDGYLAGAPGSACTESEIDDPLTTADCSKGLRAEREAEPVRTEDSALCSELESSGEGEEVGGMVEGDGVAMEVGNANETGRVSQTAKPENPTMESTAQPQEVSQWMHCSNEGGAFEDNIFGGNDERILMPPFCITQADNCAPVNDEYYDREAGSIEGGEASVPSDVDSPATIAAVDNDASASAEPVQRVETCVENIEGAVEDDACVDDMDEEDSDEFFEAREVLENSQDRTEASFSGTVDDAPAVEATVDDVTDDCEIGGGAAAEDPREAASSSDDDSTWFDARDRNPQTVTQPPHSLAPGSDHDHYCTKSAVKTEPRDNKAEFRAQLGELGIDGKTAALVFLENPTVRAVDPSPAMFTAEERRLVSATCSASEWDDKVVPAPNAFLEQSRRYVSNCYAGCASGTRWPSGHDTVPAMRKRDLSPTVASRPKRPDASGEGSAYVAYSAFSTPTRHQAETDQASDKEPTVSEQYQRSLFDEQFGRARLTRPPLPGSAYNASLFSSATNVPSYSMGPKGSIAPSQAVTPGIDRKPTSSPRRSVGSGIGGRPARTPQANSPSVLRYRLRDLSPRRRVRSSLCPSLGPAHEGLGSKPDAHLGSKPDAGDSRRVAKDDLVQNEMRQQGQQPSTNNSTVHFHGTAAMENSRKRDQAFISDSKGASTMKSRRMTVDGAEERALRVPAVSEATTEVGNILLSVVSGPGGEGDAIDLRRQAREEAQVVDIARDAFADAGNDGESPAEFVFPIDTKVRSKLTDEPARRRPQMFSFANVVPAKRSRPGRDTRDDGSDHQSPVPADDVGGIDDESAGAFEFSGQRAPGRRVRQRVKVDGRAGNPSASSAPGAFLLSAPSASGLNQELGGRLFQSPGPARGGLGGLILGAGGGSMGNSAGFDEPLARSNLGRPPAPAPGTSGNPSGLFGSSKNSTQFGSGAGFWPPSAPQPQEFMFGSGPSPARAQGTSRNPSGLFGSSKNSTQFDSGAGFWSPSAPQPQEFMFGPGPSPARAQGTSRNPSGLFGTSKNSTQFDSGAGFWSPSAPQPLEFVFGPGPSPARAHPSRPFFKKNSPRSSAF